MKRILTCLLLFGLILSTMIGCNARAQALSCVKIDGTFSETVDLTYSEKNKLLSIVEQDKWISAEARCVCDYELTVDGKSIGYHSMCGTLVDSITKQALFLDEKDANRINGYLDASSVGTVKHSEELPIRFLQYDWGGWGFSSKTIEPCEKSRALIRELSALTSTGETEEWFADGFLPIMPYNLSYDHPIPIGTIWVEIGCTIYRSLPGSKQVSLVRTHFGEGEVLNLSETAYSELMELKSYHPNDYYRGIYQNGTATLTQMYDGELSHLQIAVKSISLDTAGNVYDPPANKIVLEVTSDIDQTTELRLSCQRSSDDLADGDVKTVSFQKGVPQTIELSFGGWKNSYFWIYIRGDHTTVEIKIP